MAKGIGGWLLWIGSGLWLVFHKTVEAWALEHVVKHTMKPVEGHLLQFAPAIVLFLLGLWLLWPQIRARLREWRDEAAGESDRAHVSPAAAVTTSAQEFTSLCDAATEAYSAFRRTGHVFATSAERLSGVSASGGITPGSPEDVLDWIATLLASKMTIHGKRHPSTMFERIPQGDINESKFSGGARFLRHQMYDQSIYYTDLAVRTGEFDAYLRSVLPTERRA